MTDQSVQLAVLRASSQRRDQRRRFLKLAGGAAAAAGTMSFLAGCDDDNDGDTDTPTPTPTPAPTPTPSPSPTPTPSPTASITDADIFNFALNLEYLEANFYLSAAFGMGLSDADTGGTGDRGQVTGGRQVSFDDQAVARYAREIAADELAHVRFIRSVLGASAIAQPAINIDGGDTGAFTAAARAAGIAGSGAGFDPYANDVNFLLAASLLTDVGVSAYKGSARLIVDKTNLEAAAGLLATEAYHSGLLRTVLFAKGLADPSLGIANKQGKISNARDSLDGPDDLDQPIFINGQANLVPADANGIVFGRTAEQVHNIAYLTASVATSGGFFPAGTNGVLTTSGANNLTPPPPQPPVT